MAPSVEDPGERPVSPVEAEETKSETEPAPEESAAGAKPYTTDPYYCVRSCDGHCCRDYTVLITAQDARRILDHIPGLSILDFICFYHGEVETLNYYPKIRIQGKEYCLGILTNEKTKSCVFQTGLGMCGIHDFSPMVCQTYPFTLDDEGTIAYIQGVYCQELFPPLDPEKTKAVIYQSWGEIKEYRKLVAEWNAKLAHRGTRKFLKFAGLMDYEEKDLPPEEDITFDWGRDDAAGKRAKKLKKLKKR